jgi:hypothetical protein
LATGRLAFVGGGWVQNDEANPDVGQVVEQMTEGHDWLRAHFGAAAAPRVAWQIDPFGHSSLTPTLYADMGFQAVVLNRLHFALKDDFKRQRHMEFVWRASRLAPPRRTLYAHVLHTHYSAPEGFDWEASSFPSPKITPATLESRAAALAAALLQRADAYAHRRLLVPWGDDFKFRNAETQFQNMDQLVRHINANAARVRRAACATPTSTTTLTTSCATPPPVAASSCPLFAGDFLPYADNGDSLLDRLLHVALAPQGGDARRRVARAQRR